MITATPQPARSLPGSVKCAAHSEYHCVPCAFLPQPKPMIRTMTAADRAYVLASWRLSLDRRSRRSRSTHAAAERERETLVDTQRVDLVEDATGAIVAWCCYTPLPSSPIVHYIYVREPLRSKPGPEVRIGPRFGSMLIEHAGVKRGAAIAATSSSKIARVIVAAKGLRVVEIDAQEVLR